MRLALFSLWLVATPLLAGEMIGLGNDMDGDCFQASSGTIRKSYRASHQILSLIHI